MEWIAARRPLSCQVIRIAFTCPPEKLSNPRIRDLVMSQIRQSPPRANQACRRM